MFSLAPNARSRLRPESRRIIVSITEIIICVTKQLPRVFSASSLLPLPIKIEARGAPPLPTKAANAVIIIMIGIHTPTPVKASAPLSGICPM